MALTSEELAEIGMISSSISQMSSALSTEGLVAAADRQVDSANITKINTALGLAADYLASIIPPVIP